MYKRSRILIGLLCLSLVLVGCEDKFRKAAQLSKDFSVAVKTIQQAEISAHDSGTLDDQTHVDIQRILIDVALSGKELDNAIRVAHSQPNAIVSVKAALDTLDRLQSEGLVKISDSATKQKLDIAVASARAVLGSISALLEGK